MNASQPAAFGRISRRDALRRGAVLGGALAWSTPAVQAVARPAFASQGTPVADYSYVAIVVRTEDPAAPGQFLYCSYKFDLDGGSWEQGGATPPHVDPPPCQPDGWDKQGPAECPDVSSMFFGGGAPGQPIGPDGSCFYTLSITLGDWVFHDARVKHQQEGCSDDLLGLGTTTLSFRPHPNPCA